MPIFLMPLDNEASEIWNVKLFPSNLRFFDGRLFVVLLPGRGVFWDYRLQSMLEVRKRLKEHSIETVRLGVRQFIVYDFDRDEDFGSLLGISGVDLRMKVEDGLKRFCWVFCDVSEFSVLANEILTAPLLAACLLLSGREVPSAHHVLEFFDIALKFPVVELSNSPFVYRHSLNFAKAVATMQIFGNLTEKTMRKFLSLKDFSVQLSRNSIFLVYRQAILRIINHFGLPILRVMYLCDYNFGRWLADGEG